ncbi:MAG: hypothetical protein LUG60_01985 [Erysipelotrichaceae bacterium]|nr:hypothetical protein [Erysipelotrichaceae bacterium]
MEGNNKIFEEDVMEDEFDDEIVYSYYDGIPEWIQNMSHKELVESLKEDIEQLPSPIRENLLELIEY